MVSRQTGNLPMTEAAPKIAFVTMVRGDAFYLRRWIAHNAAIVPRQHLFILIDGLDQTPIPEAEGCQYLMLPRVQIGPGWEARRWVILSDFAATLLGRFDVVVLNDVDELLITDPALGMPLGRAIARAHEVGVISPFALEIIHRPDLEPEPLDPARPILGQRRHVRINATYCKPCVISQPVRWSLGGHYCDFPTLHLDDNLFLIHLRYIDRSMLLDRQAARHAMMQANASGGGKIAGPSWAKSVDEIDGFLNSFIAHGAPEPTDLRFEWQRKRIRSQWEFDEAQNIWRHPTLHNRRSYVLPDRVLGLF